MAVKAGVRNTVRVGPVKGVWNSKDPFDGGPNKWRDARNTYQPDPEAGGDTLARPGFVVLNNGGAIYTSATPFKGQGLYTTFGLDGLPINFLVFGGHLFRYNPATGLTTDVTPVGITIDSATTTRVYFATMGGTLCVTDGVNRPWVATNLSSTPITGTYIDFTGTGTAWAAYGPPVVYGGSGFFVLTSVGGVSARLDIAWTEPNDWTTGYQQTNFDNRWTLEQTGTTPLFGLVATNVALYYFRQRSIGSISGVVGPDLATTATHDAVSTNIGSQAPQTFVQFNNTIFFCDQIGRPWMFTLGSRPQPIWHQLRGLVDTSSAADALVTAQVASATLEATLNLYCVAIWSPLAASSASPTEWHTFDADTGTYLGRMSIGPADPGVSVDCLGSFIDAQGLTTTVALGSLTAGGVSGYAWGMNALVGVVVPLVTEDLTTTLTDESTPAVSLTTEGQEAIWTDNGAVPLITVATDRLGYSDDMVWLYDRATVLTGTQAPITVTATTPNAASVVTGTPTPNASADGIYRTQLGLDVHGRGCALTISPTTATEQWSIATVAVTGVANPASADDD